MFCLREQECVQGLCQTTNMKKVDDRSAGNPVKPLLHACVNATIGPKATSA